MLTRSNKRKLEFFKASTELAQSIDIYLEDENDPSSFYDKDDKCLHAVVRSYDAGVVQSDTPMHLSGPQVVVWLHDLKNIQIRLNTSDADPRYDKETILVKCAMQSILRKLAAQGYIEKTNLLFQVRPRGKVGGPMFCMQLNPEENGCSLSASGPITHTFAYLDDNHMCIFLNADLLKEKTLELKNAVATITGPTDQITNDDESHERRIAAPR